MAPGDVFHGEIELTNHGLVRADALDYRLPADDAHFRYDLLAPVPGSLEAGERVRIPFRLVALQGLGLATQGDAGGGGCYSYSACSEGGYSYQCANGVITESPINGTCWTRSWGECSTDSTGGVGGTGHAGPGTVIFHPPGTPGTGFVSPAEPLPGAKCIPTCNCEPRRACPCQAPGSGADGGAGGGEGAPARDPMGGTPSGSPLGGAASAGAASTGAAWGAPGRPMSLSPGVPASSD
jgi:hypothetical protein